MEAGPGPANCELNGGSGSEPDSGQQEECTGRGREGEEAWHGGVESGGGGTVKAEGAGMVSGQRLLSLPLRKDSRYLGGFGDREGKAAPTWRRSQLHLLT